MINLDEWYGAKRQSRLRAERRRRAVLVLWVLALALLASAGLGALLRLITGTVLP